MVNRLVCLAFFSLAEAATWASPVALRAVTFDPMVAPPVVPVAWRASLPAGDAPARFLVQFAGRPTVARQSRLAAFGVALSAYLPENTFIVRSRPSALARALAARAVAWAGPFHPYYKLSPELGKTRLTGAERLVERIRGTERAVLHIFVGEDAALVEARARSKGLEVLGTGSAGPHHMVEVKGSLALIEESARWDSVQFVEESGEATLRNETTTWVVQSNQNGVRPLWAQNLKGQGQTVGLIDGPMYMGHNCFLDPNNNPIGPTHRKVVMYSSGSGLGSDSHGTHTAGTIAGDREPVNGQVLNNGHAPKARIAFTNLSDVGNTNLYDKFVAAYNAGAKDNSNSWGNDGTRSYTSHCLAIDQFSYDFEDATVAFAVSNGSIVTTPENAKSCLAVGATNQSPNQGTVGSGGTGPTQDGRRKPEVFAPGIGIVSASSGTTDSFRSLSGTSMACPAITGEAALVRQWFREGRYMEGGPISNLGMQPSGALVRAMVLNGAVDMTGVSGYPSNAEGFGRLLADNVLWFPGEARRTKFRDYRRAQGLATGQSRVFRFLVQDANAPLRITMTFTDFPATVNAATAWVNDLDLEVAAPDGTVYKGNVFNTAVGESVTGGTADNKNSTEMVVRLAPLVGLWTVTVRATNVPQGGAQGYALVANGNLHPLNMGG